MEQKINYEWKSPGEFIRHPLHQKMLLNPEEKNQAGYKESCHKYGKLRPVLYVKPSEAFILDGISYEPNRDYAIDGWAYITDSKEQGIPLVLALKVEATTEEEIMQVIAQANSTYHTSHRSLYMIAAALYPVHSKGKGSRSDLKENVPQVDNDETEVTDENTDTTEVTAPKRRPTTYEIIGAMMGGLSGNYIKYLLLIGRVNPLYFERIDHNRMSLYAAYCHCRKEESGELPEPPKVHAPVYVNDMTDIPHYEEPSTTVIAVEDDDATNTITDKNPNLINNGLVAENTEDTIAPTNNATITNNPEYVIVPVTCSHCGEHTEQRILKSELLRIFKTNLLS